MIELLAGVAFAIAPGPLAKAVNEWGKQAHIQVLFNSSDLRGLGTLGFSCTDCDMYEALDRLIDGQPVEWDVARKMGKDLTVVLRITLDEPNL